MKPLVVAAAGLAVAARAFVVVPEIAEADSDIVSALPFEAPFTADAQSLRLSCPGCPIYWQHHHAGWGRGRLDEADVPNHLELSFVVDHVADTNRLLLNDFELYPHADPFHDHLTAPQVMDFLEAARKHPRKGRPHRAQLGYSLSFLPVVKEQADQQLELIEIHLQIIEVGETLVDGIPVVKVKLIKTPAGSLAIASVETVDAPSTKPKMTPETPDDKPCNTVACSWKAFVADRLKGMKKGFKPCAGHAHHGQHKSMPKEEADGSRVIYNHHHTWKQLFKNITSYILLPVLIGIVAGVSLSIIGMMVGTLAVCIWRVFVRRQSPWTRRHCRRRGHSCHKTNQAEAPVAVEEKSGLMEHQEPPPEYEPVTGQEDSDVKV